MNFKQFENAEQERFLDTYFNYKKTKSIIYNLDKQNYSKVRDSTKTGIQEGVEEFLCTQSNSKTLYLTDLTEFCTDNTISMRIKDNIMQLNPNLANISAYGEEVSQYYKLFIYNSSFDRFSEIYQDIISLDVNQTPST